VLSLAVLAGVTSGATALHKDVTLKVDGKLLESGVFALTVQDVLASHGIEVEPGDIVTPSLDAPAADGQVISVNFKKSVAFDIDGEVRTVLTNAATVAEALASFDALEIDLAEAALSHALSSQLSPEGDRVVITTRKDVALSLMGKSKPVSTTSRTVAELLAEHKVAYDADDRISPSLDTVLTPDAVVKVSKVETQTLTRKEKVEFTVQIKKVGTLWASERRIARTGKDGKAERTYQVVKVNGKVESETLLSENILTKPVTQVEEHGTKTTSQGKKINLARAAMWDKIAKCESGNRWGINTGNGYYGGLQFSKSSWNANGGRDFAAYPHQASRAEQITVANRYYAKAGLRPWSCKP
jgi:uncharacterized protein YabE (DUF348 family)